MCGTAFVATANVDSEEEQDTSAPFIPAYEREGERLPKPPEPVGSEDGTEQSTVTRECPLCGNLNPTDAQWCQICDYGFGAVYDEQHSTSVDTAPTMEAAVGRLTCPRCHHRNDIDSSFCVNCGLPFEGETVPLYPGSDPRIGSTGTPFQGFWIRLLALFIDLLVTLVLEVLVGGVIGGLIGLSIGLSDPNFETSSIDQAIADAEGWITLGQVLVFSIYHVILVGAFGATVGKLIVGIKIVQKNGRRVGYGHALGRYLATYISALILGIGFLMVAFRQDKRSLHDLIAGTVVVRRN